LENVGDEFGAGKGKQNDREERGIGEEEITGGMKGRR